MIYEEVEISTVSRPPKALPALATPALHVYVPFANKRPAYSFFKRLLDIVFSSFLCLFILSWLLPLLALLIKLESPGPVFFFQKRTGYRGKGFLCIKFRTMKVNDTADLLQASDNDDRVTRIGRFLRNTNLDELPQLFNVLKGDMSIIGPRPHMLLHTHEFAIKIEEYKLRLEVKPGLTGLAQIKGWRGPTPTFRSIYKRVQWDVYYVRHQGIGLDAYIFISTIKEVISNFCQMVFIR